MEKEKREKQKWQTVSWPSYLGGNKDVCVVSWDRDYGRGNWRLAWELSNKEVLNFEQIFEHYVESYCKHFEIHPGEALFLTDYFSYAFDLDYITKEQAFNPTYLYDRPGKANQFHHVALNFSLEYYHGLEFKGKYPIRVREGGRDSNPDTWPAGWIWSPGRIPSSHPELIPPRVGYQWWQSGSIEDLYQSAKILQIKK